MDVVEAELRNILFNGSAPHHEILREDFLVWFLFVMEKVAINCKEKSATVPMVSPAVVKRALNAVINERGISIDVKQIDITKPFEQEGKVIKNARFVVHFEIHADCKMKAKRAKEKLFKRISLGQAQITLGNEKDSAELEMPLPGDKPIQLTRDFGALEYDVKQARETTIQWLPGKVVNGVLDCKKCKEEGLFISQTKQSRKSRNIRHSIYRESHEVRSL